MTKAKQRLFYTHTHTELHTHSLTHIHTREHAARLLHDSQCQSEATEAVVHNSISVSKSF